MNELQRKIQVDGGMAVYGLPGDELRTMILEHIASIEACAAKVGEALAELPSDADADAPPELQRAAVFRGTLLAFKQAEEEARYLADHVRLDHRFMLTATQILAFRQRWGKLVVDVERLAMAPRSATAASEQAERSLASTITATPRIVLPDGSLTRSLGL